MLCQQAIHPDYQLRNWHESMRESDATVLVFDVSTRPDGTRLEELAGIAIHDGTSLYLAVRRGFDWQQLSGPTDGTDEKCERMARLARAFCPT